MDLQNISSFLTLDGLELQEAFPVELSLRGLLRYANVKDASTDNGRLNWIAQTIQNDPALQAKTIDLFYLLKKETLLSSILALTRSPLQRRREYSLILKPFSFKAIFSDIAVKEARENIKWTTDLSRKTLSAQRQKRACQLIARQIYGIPLKCPLPKTNIYARNEDTQLESIYRLELISDFVLAEPIGRPPELAAEVRQYLIENPQDVERALANISLENFTFSGIEIAVLTDVTKEELGNKLRKILIYGADEQNPSIEKEIQRLLRSYLSMPDINLSLHQYSTGLLGEGVANLFAEEMKQSILGKAMSQSKPLIIPDFEKTASSSFIDQGILQKGFRALVLAPAINKQTNKTIGLIQLAHRLPAYFSKEVLRELEEIFLMLSHLLQRRQEIKEHQIQEIMQEYFTNIHLSVLWKFREVAIQLFARKKQGTLSQKGVPPITFAKVHPLYGQADIVGSTRLRNEAIQADLIENLKLASRILKEINFGNEAIRSIKLALRVENKLGEIQRRFFSNDEAGVVEFLTYEVHPYLREIKEAADADSLGLLENYFQLLNPKLGVIYKKRKDYEESVTFLNRALDGYMEAADSKMQAFLPHYFEKYTTDGLEFTIYLGQSLLEEKRFLPSHLQEFNRWLLIRMCEITRLVTETQSKTPVKLRTAQLVFWYSETLDIHFEQDEKHFGVDGAYNIRYEILKKRIDKAVIEGSGERLTVSGKIAIVYLNPKDRETILQHLDYLSSQNYISDSIEDLVLAKMQGVEGLRAIRVAVKP